MKLHPVGHVVQDSPTMNSEKKLSDHYKVLAPDYDKYYAALARAKADFIRKFIPLAPDDQIVDVGGGTAQVSIMVKEAVGMSKPVVCVDPSKEMLAVAQKNGAITIQSAAEDFLATKPDYPLKVVFMNGVAHHFENPRSVFTGLAKNMPDDGACVVLLEKYPANIVLPWFKHHKGQFMLAPRETIEMLSELIKSVGLMCTMVSDKLPVEVNKEVFFSSLKDRFMSPLEKLTDEELLDGIVELEEQFKGVDVLKCDVVVYAIIVTKK